MESLRPKHLALDFDNTLAHFEGGREGIFDLFTSYGVPIKTVEHAYEETKKSGGFNIDRLLELVQKKSGVKLNEQEIKRGFAKWLSKSLRLYPDAEELLNKLNREGGTYSIISVGDKIYQEQKISSLGLKPRSVSVVPSVGEKPAILQKLVLETDGPVMYIDDKASELDAIKRDLGEQSVITIRINRTDSPYKNEKAEYKHREIGDLGEIDI